VGLAEQGLLGEPPVCYADEGVGEQVTLRKRGVPGVDLAPFQNMSDRGANWTAGKQRESALSVGSDRVTKLGPFQKVRDTDGVTSLNTLSHMRMETVII